ncbi:uncharacterized protein LOC125037165 isoform X2 [Penaeus chinensis]|uniref:uncharacterized protein LOC125037165 isoform X2 n=1 Tax=Penaeus chinensis TaxID=139456 RepID=UPI001FB7B75E|nr:uncharacterized protein LOC125037165 isoform X2 [Penaeus chinensis]
MRRKEVVNMTSVIGTKFSLSCFYGKEEKHQMMYRMRLNVLNKSHGMKKAAGTAIRRGRGKMSVKYDELKMLDSFYATPSHLKLQKRKVRQNSSKKNIEARNPRPSRQVSAAASEMASLRHLQMMTLMRLSLTAPIQLRKEQYQNHLCQNQFCLNTKKSALEKIAQQVNVSSCMPFLDSGWK